MQGASGANLASVLITRVGDWERSLTIKELLVEGVLYGLSCRNTGAEFLEVTCSLPSDYTHIAWVLY